MRPTGATGFRVRVLPHGGHYDGRVGTVVGWRGHTAFVRFLDRPGLLAQPNIYARWLQREPQEAFRG